MKQELIEAVKTILAGIDATEKQSEDGWWEDEVSADFGADKLADVIEAIDKFVKE